MTGIPFKHTPVLPTRFRHRYLHLCLCSVLAMPGGAQAGPEGGVVSSGSGSIEQLGNTTTIQQQSEQIVIDWQSYNVGSDERVQYIQPGSESLSVNQIHSNSASRIHGRIDANGKVVLINPNGISFGAGSTINVGSLVASGLVIAGENNDGELILEALEGTEGVVINEGLIEAATGGSVVLLSQQVENSGLIKAQLGSVSLAAGSEAVLTFNPSGTTAAKCMHTMAARSQMNHVTARQQAACLAV